MAPLAKRWLRTGWLLAEIACLACLAWTAVLALAGAPAGRTPANGPLKVHPDNPRYFADPSGRAVL